MKSPSAINRRACLALFGSAASLPLLARAAYQADGPALQRPLAAQALATDIVLAGQRLVAVGERGHVLLSDDEGKAWRQAQAVPTRSTLTSVFAADERTLWAVGHGGIVLRSIDAGERWTLVAGQPEGREVLLSIRIGPDGRGLAVGGFGYALRTQDGGAHWERATLLEGDAGERHFNRIFLSPAGTWLVAAEGGLVLRGEERGQRWQAVKTPYAGSLWSGAALGQGVLLACGMRGNIVRSSDDGRSWSAAQVPGLGSLTAVAPLPDGRCVLAGVDGGFAVGSAGGERFTAHPLADRSTLTGVAVLSARRLVASGAQGMRAIDISPL